MKTVSKGIQLRFILSESQRRLLERHFGANRWLYNHFLYNRQIRYQLFGEGSDHVKDCKALTSLKREVVWLNEVSNASLQRSLKHLDAAYRNFFKQQGKFPRFKSKHGHQSYTLSSPTVRIEGKRLIIPKFKEGLKFHRDLPAFHKINNVTITRTPDGRYYASLSVEAMVRELPKTGASIGLDLGLKDFAVLSDGTRIANPKFLDRELRRLKQAQQHLARKMPGGQRRHRQKVKVARLHRRIANCRLNFLHQTAKALVNRFDRLHLEDLDTKALLGRRQLSRGIGDAGWGRFGQLLAYKCAWYGKSLVKIGRFAPSSKACGGCGAVNNSLTLAERTWQCPSCGRELDRDLNAAHNILTLGTVIADHRRGGSVSPAMAVPAETSNPLVLKG